MEHQLTTLPNGLRLITHHMPSTRSIAIGCWVDTGSRDETATEAGASHFLEHLLFKGSTNWSAREISEALDGVGARHNAFTTKEYTCFWMRLRDADFPLGLEILSEMMLYPAFRQDEIDSERHVVLEEINMNEDDPSDVAHEQFIQALWPDHPLSPPILGTKESITEMSRDTIHTYWERRYTPYSTVVAVAGNVPEDVVAQVAARFGGWRGDATSHVLVSPEVSSRVEVRTKDTEQAHLVFGSASFPRDDDRRYALMLADHVLGGGMSSRLFHEIREVRGLAYSVQSFRMPFADAGASAVYVGTAPGQTAEVLCLVRSEIDRMINDGLTEEELTRAKGHGKGSLALGLEDALSRMNRIGRTELMGMEHLTVDDTVEVISRVSHEEVLEAAKAAYSAPYVMGAVGPFSAGDLEEFVQ